MICDESDSLSLCVTKLFPAEGLWLELLAEHKILTATMQWKNTIHTNTHANMHKGTYTQTHQKTKPNIKVRAAKSSFHRSISRLCDPLSVASRLN